MSDEEIILEECHDKKGRYQGKIIIRKDVLTPEFVEKIKADKQNEMGYKKYKKTLKKHGYDV